MTAALILAITLPFTLAAVALWAARAGVVRVTISRPPQRPGNGTETKP